MKNILVILKKIFSKKKYLSESQIIGFNKSNLEEKSREKIDQKIANSLTEIDDIEKQEERRRMEIKVLYEILEEDPEYYSKKELKLIIEKIDKKKTLI